MRLVDLHCDWLRQYAGETTLYEPGLYPEIPGRVARLDGYLLGTSLAVLVCARKSEDWSNRPDAWGALGLMIARYEAEFAGRLLGDPDDVRRWRSWPADGMCWGVLGVSGFDSLVRGADDLDRLPGLFDRGVRVFRAIADRGGVLGGSASTGDDRGLTDLGRAFLDRIAAMSRGAASGPRPILDLAGMNAQTMADALRWYDGRSEPGGRPLLAVTHGDSGGEDLLEASTPEARNLRDLRARGGVIGLTPGARGCGSAEDLKRRIESIAAVPFEGRPGYEGLAIGTDLLGMDQPAPGLGTAREISRWLSHGFDRRTAGALTAGNARRLLLRSVGGESETVGTGH